METNDNAQTILSAGAALAVPKFTHESGRPFAALPQDYTVRDLESFMPAPARKRGNITTTQTDSFIAYVLKHGHEDITTLYADVRPDVNRFALEAVLDDHSALMEGQNWREHRCKFTPTLAVEWGRWTSKNGVNFTQAEFATWLEDNLPDIATVDGMPTGADILQMATGFEANADKAFVSRINLQSGGVELVYSEVENTSTRSKMTAFERFTLGIPVFDGSAAAYPLTARLKYRPSKEGKLIFWYQLIRPDRVFQTAVKDELDRIADETRFQIIHGQP